MDNRLPLVSSILSTVIIVANRAETKPHKFSTSVKTEFVRVSAGVSAVFRRAKTRGVSARRPDEPRETRSIFFRAESRQTNTRAEEGDDGGEEGG